MGVCMREKTVHTERGGTLLTCFDVAMDDATLVALHEGQKNSSHVASHLHATKLTIALFIGSAGVSHLENRPCTESTDTKAYSLVPQARNLVRKKGHGRSQGD
jgi:hypothetical protein